MTTNLPAHQREILGKLAQNANSEHRAVMDCVRDGLDHAMECGRLLAEARTQVPHGRWLPWLRDNFAASVRTAQGYIRLHERQDQLPNAQRVAHLPVREALALLAEPKTSDTADISAKPTPTREPGEDDGEPPDPDDIPMDPAGSGDAGQVTDKTGRMVEGKVAEAFRRRQEIQDLMTAVSRVKMTVLRAVEAKDTLFADINPSRFEAEANNLHHQLRSAMPYAACPYCRAAGCKACYGRGWVGEFVYERAPRELKA